MSDATSKLLREKKEQIMALWTARCVQEVASASAKALPTLRDSMPIYIDHLSEALASTRKMDFRSINMRNIESARIGKMHGADRASSQSYELSEVISEYHILRSRSAQEGSKTGWGLGLTLVKGIMDAHGGTVEVTSSDAGGTVFTLKIPRYSQQPRALAQG